GDASQGGVPGPIQESEDAESGGRRTAERCGALDEDGAGTGSGGGDGGRQAAGPASDHRHVVVGRVLAQCGSHGDRRAPLRVGFRGGATERVQGCSSWVAGTEDPDRAGRLRLLGPERAASAPGCAPDCRERSGYSLPWG